MICHFVYWAVLGDFNSMKLDDFHQNALLITLVKRLDEFEVNVMDSLMQLARKREGESEENFTRTKLKEN